MSGVAATPASPLADWWRWLRNPAFWMPVADTFAILTAASLPWSTSAVGIFTACWLGSSALIIDYPAWFRSLKQPICAMPLALFALATVGILWSEASWSAGLHALAPAVKLLYLPGLFQYFARSTRGMWVFAAFLASCTLLMVMSWLVLLDPGISLQRELPQRGIFVKNYIAQSQEFTLCAVVLAYPIYKLVLQRRIGPALALSAIALALIVNMVFVIASRTALVTTPLLLSLFAVLHLSRRTSLLMLGAAIVLAGLSWVASPQLRATVNSTFVQYQLYKEHNVGNSTGLRLEFLQKSLRFMQEAPLLGHGTGSIRTLFEHAAVGSPDHASGFVVENPHNQTLYAGVQWGILGIVVLWAMWLSHLLIFRGQGLVAWIGLVVVVQNILTSQLNSHIFDFHEGWMYVLGVGVAGGMVLGARSQPRTPDP